MSFGSAFAETLRRIRFSHYHAVVGNRESCRLHRVAMALSVLTLLGLIAAPGHAGFIAASTYDAGQSPFSAAVGDFNGDGIPDLAVANIGVYPNNGTVTILIGNGDGSFQAPQTYLVEAGQLGLGDFNGDGHLDIVTSSGFILLGNGDGTFQPAQSYGPTGSSIAIADFNGDGELDVALATFSAAPHLAGQR